MGWKIKNPAGLLLTIAVSLTCILSLVSSSDFKTEKPPYSDFLNYGKKKIKPGPELENEIIKSKVEVLGEILKHHVHILRQVPRQKIELVFLVDASASVGAENFFNEIKFVKKLLADFAVSYNQTRVAVVTFSSKSKVIRHIDHITQAYEGNHKCTLLEKELPRIRYSGGGTFTLGAMLEAQKVLALARSDATKAVFLVTDGYSNGGDPRPAAAFLQARGVKIFTFGIRNGNVKELYDMASEPKEEHSYILDSFEEFEALARRALHEDLHSGVLMPQDPLSCRELCSGDAYCCDGYATCTCGTHTGHYACTCKKGYYGTGLRGDCRPCPPGTFRDAQGPGDISSCTPCPDPHMMSDPGSTDASRCYCKRGYKQMGNTCARLQCPALDPPENGYFVRNTCNNIVNAACGVRCNSGYTLRGSSIRLCGENGQWSGGDAECVMKSCPPLKSKAHGTMVCSKQEPTIDTECYFTCDPGYQLVGSKKRTCLPVAMWDGIPAYCKAISCPALPKLKHGLVKPQSCATAKSKYGTRCEFACDSGYQISGPIKTTCIDPGVWSEGHKSPRCIDVTPPKIMCPRNITTVTDPHEAFASVTWDQPFFKDNSKGEVVLTTVPATTQPMKLKIGQHHITYIAKDLMGNTASCQFSITVADEEPPQIDWCDSPPVFLSHEEVVDVYWEEPIFSDNSGTDVQVTRSMEPGQFPQGDTLVEYVAVDHVGNVASCNITITVQKHACQMPVDPINGVSNCTENPNAVFCSLTCEDGYAFAMRPQQDYFCAYDGIWLPDDNPMPFPDCSVTSVSNTVAQAGELAMDDDGSVCDDIFFMGQVENELEKKLEEALSEMCSADIVCEVAAVEAVCEEILSDIEEESNSIGFFRKRRSVDDDTFDYYWPQRHKEDESWNYWKRGSDVSSVVRVHRNKRDIDISDLKTITRRKRQFGISLDHIFGYKSTTEAPYEVSKDKGFEENYLGVLIDVITRSFASDVGSARFTSFLSDQKSSDGKFSPDDFFKAFAKEFGEDKMEALRELAGRKLAGMKIPGLPEFGTSSNSTKRLDRSPEDVPIFFPSSVPSSFKQETSEGLGQLPHSEGGQKTLKLRFKVEGHGEGATDQLQDAVTGIRKAADKGMFDVSFGEQQLRVAAIRLKEHPEYVCEPGSVPRGDLCVKCPVGTFYNVILRECQACPQGSFQPSEGQVSCMVCPENTSTKSGNSKSGNDCKAQCLPGSYSIDGLEPCTTCDLGQYQDEYASLDCATCPINTTTWRRGSWIMEECKAQCKKGEISETGLEPCLPCPRGFFQKDEGKTECFRCPDEATTALAGSASIFECEGVSEEEQAAYTNLQSLPINDCFSEPCLNGGSCALIEFGFQCNCQPGFSGQLCEVETNECESEPCLNNGTCTDLLDSYSCQCLPGYEGPQCETDINECQPNPCQNGATCVDMVDAFKCICQSGYTGEICDINIDECATNPCAEGATCEDLLNDIFCHCPPGDTGRFCETHINECDSSPCDHGLCIDGVGAFSCVCEPGYKGATCEEDIDECAPNPCQNGGTCTDLVNGFSCTCPPGMTDTVCGTELPNDFVLEFPSSGILDYVSIENLSRDLNSASLCFWMHTEDRENYGTPFSYATDDYDNALTITDYNGFVLYVNGDKRITDVQGNDGQWHMICVTWKNTNGTWAIYLDGKLADSGNGLATDTVINGTGTLILGQEQDQRAGGYSPPESFIGDLTRLDIWGDELSPKFIEETFVKCDRYVGDILGWPDVQAGIKGKVMTKSSTFCRGCGVPYVPDHGSIQEIKKDSIQRISVTCEEGYKLYRGDPERVCLVNGTWSGHEPECERVSCGFPGYLINGRMEGKSYSFGDKIIYSCNKGFHLHGAVESVCQADGFWTHEQPTCEVVKCPKLSASAHGQVMTHLLDYMPTNKISFRCEEGYQMDGPGTLTCGQDGEWDGQPPTCQSGSCGELPVIANGYIEGGPVLSPGDQVVVKCELGYKIEGDPLITCKDDGTWSLPLPKCITPKCSKPPGIENGQVKVRASAEHKEAVYKCDPGYEVVGRKKLTCGSDGEWDGPWSTCEGIPCPRPEVPPHANMPVKEIWRVSDTLVYECDLGFKLQGEKTIKCMFDGDNAHWQGTVPSCHEIKCPVPTKPSNGIVTILHNPPSLLNTFIIPDAEVETLSRRKRSPTDDFPVIFPSIQKSYDDEWLPDNYDYSEFDQEVGQSYDDLGQTAGSFDEFGQSAGSFDEFGQSAGGFEEFGQSAGSFDEFGQSVGGFDEFGQSAGSFDEFGQSAGGFDEFGQSAGSFDEFGQSVGGFDEFGQSAGGFDYSGQTYGQSSGGEYEDFFDSGIQESKGVGLDLGIDIIENGEYVFGAKIEYDCRPGFKLLGERHLECTQSGTWSAPEPRCYEQFCSDLPPVENGRIVFHGSGLNSRAQYICNEGYELTGEDFELVCQFDKTWLGEIPQCQIIDCGDPPDIINGTIDFSSTTFGSLATYDCFFGFVIEGSFDRYCGADGNWNGTATTCEAVTCSVPPVIDDGYITFEGSLYVNSPIEYECKECYHLNGTRFRYCQVDGSWSLEEPICELIYCNEVPTSIPDGRVIGNDNSCGSLVEYECSPGYELKGKKKATCLENKKWSSPIPSCEKISCGPPQVLENGNHIGANYDFTDKITFECNEGYILQGSKVQVCEADGTWSSAPPFCAIVNCTKPLGPSNGRVRLSGLFYGSTADIVCDRGFKLDGDRHIVCRSDGQWDKKVPRCEPIICPPAPTLPFSSYNSTELQFEAFTLLAYECYKGYFSTNDEDTLFCSEDGNWVGDRITCEPVDCGDPGTLPNGLIKGNSNTFGSKITFVCNDGYNLLGEPEAKCLEDGSWSNYVTSCLQITCPEPQQIEFGKMISGDPGSTYGTSVSYECNIGYIMTGSKNITCNANGAWSGIYPQCRPVTCPEPFESLNAVRKGDIFAYGKKITYECNEGYAMEGESGLVCEADGSWSDEVPVCEMIVCDEIPEIPHGSWQVKSTKEYPIKTEPDPTLGHLKGYGFASQFAKLQDLLQPDEKEGLIHRFGEVVEFKCDPGYYMSSESIIECTENGWSSSLPHCLPISCPIPIQIRNGVVIGDDYSYGSTISYKCDEGHELVGESSRTCQQNKEWTDTEPLCRVIECPRPALLDNGQTIGFSIKYRSIISYICDDGFRLEGVSTRTCQSDGHWTGEQPACVELYCEIPEEVTHGIRDIESLKAGGTVRYSCLEGYRLVGRTVINCGSDGNWDGSPPVCHQIDCGPPPSGENVLIQGNSTIYNSKVVFSCERGYKISGQEWATCLHSGRWSSEAPECELILCPEPVAPLHGKLLEAGPGINEISRFSQALQKGHRKGKKGKKLSKMIQPVIAEKVYHVDDELSWICDEGFQLEGLGNAKCLPSGQWSSITPRCRRVSCGPPELPDNARVEGDGFLYAAIATYTCRDGYELKGNNTLICESDGNWSSDAPVCEPVYCGPPQLSEHLLAHFITVEHKKPHSFGSTASYTCGVGYELKGGQYQVCEADGIWSGSTPICEEALCVAPPHIPDGDSHVDSSVIPQVATFTCHKGHTLEGDNTTECHLGRWKEYNTTCTPVDCCKPEVPPYGQITAEHFYYGSIANYSCIHGYMLIGNPYIECTENGTWQGEMPICQPVDCGTPDVPANGHIESSLTDLGSESLYYCDKGFQLFGNDSRVCTADAKWSGDPPQCHRVVCGELTAPEKGFVMGVGKMYGDRVKFACENGYELDGESQAECLDTGKWSVSLPKCKPVACELPPSPPNTQAHLVDATKNYVFKDRITYRCQEGFITRGDLTIKCLHNGHWSRVQGQCSKISCGRPKINVDGAVILGRSFYYRDNVFFRCPPGTYANGSTVLTCLQDGSWSGAPNCVGKCSKQCFNGGICANNNLCLCPSGFKGDRCQHAMCLAPCLNGGTCVAPYKCKCLPGYGGPRCQNHICENGCGDRGRCIGPNVCHCERGFTGPTCDKEEYDYEYEERNLDPEQTDYRDWDFLPSYSLRGIPQ